MTPFHPAPGDPDLDRGNSPGTGPAADEGSFKVPVGVSPSGELVPARKAKGEVSYRCPGCGGPLLLRKGEIRSAHFAHKPEAHCAAETALHSGVKHWIAAILRKRLGDRRVAAPKLRVPCCGIGPPMPAGVRSPCRGQAWFPLQDLEFDQVELEATTPEGLRPDVLLLRQGTPALGIEVLVTHAVDAAKAAKASYPWVEVDAMQVVGAPRAWKPCQQSHPWTGLCRACQWAEEVSSVAFSEADDPMECVAELSAALFERHLNRWLASRANRTRPALVWRCPWCRKRNLRLLGRERVFGAARSSCLGPPIVPEVLLEVGRNVPVSILFDFPRNPRRPWVILPLAQQGRPVFRVTPDPKRPLRLLLNGTNRPMVFICPKCQRDCLGCLPSPWIPCPESNP